MLRTELKLERNVRPPSAEQEVELWYTVVHSIEETLSRCCQGYVLGIYITCGKRGQRKGRTGQKVG